MKTHGRILVASYAAFSLVLLSSCADKSPRPTPPTTTTTRRPTTTTTTTTTTRAPTTTTTEPPVSRREIGPYLKGKSRGQVVAALGPFDFESNGPGLYRTTLHYKGLGRVELGKFRDRVVAVHPDPKETGEQ